MLSAAPTAVSLSKHYQVNAFQNYMKLKRIEVLSFLIVVATFVAGVLVYPSLPERIASHWGAGDQVNGYMGKFWGVFLLPIIMLVISFIFLIIPRVDPKKQNIEKFSKYFNMFILAFLLFFSYIYSLTIFWNLGYRFPLFQFMVPALAFLFFVVGIMIKHAEPNWSIGIRTPWTLSSENVWYKTHKLGGKLFQASAVISLLGITMPRYSAWFVLLPIIISAIFLVLYSYLEYRKEQN
jgi:uncharacterized membrane protein